MIDFGDFEIETLTFEVRYDPALLIWDKTGSMWAEVTSQFPELKWQNAAPTQQVFESRNVRAMVEFEALRVICRGSDADKRVVEIGQALLRSCADKFDISVFKRVGFREIRIRRFPTFETAIDELRPVIPRPFLTTPISDAKPTSVGISIKHEGEVSGLTAALKLDVREPKITIPWEFKDRLTDVFPKEHVMSFDNDYFTIGTTRREALSVEDWVKQAYRTISRHWKGVLG